MIVYSNYRGYWKNKETGVPTLSLYWSWKAERRNIAAVSRIWDVPEELVREAVEFEVRRRRFRPWLWFRLY